MACGENNPCPQERTKNEISNCRLIANLCGVTKIFEKLILQRIADLEEEKNVDMTGTNQHGFKKGRSTSTAGLSIQSALARALDQKTQEKAEQDSRINFNKKTIKIH